MKSEIRLMGGRALKTARGMASITRVTIIETGKNSDTNDEMFSDLFGKAVECDAISFFFQKMSHVVTPLKL